MNGALWFGLLMAALGTYLMRWLPLLWMRRRLTRTSQDAHVDAIPTWLAVLGPMMIAAVLGVSLIPRQPDAASWIATLVGLGAALLVWWRSRSLGLPVTIGIVTFGLVVVAIRALL